MAETERLEQKSQYSVNAWFFLGVFL